MSGRGGGALLSPWGCVIQMKALNILLDPVLIEAGIDPLSIQEAVQELDAANKVLPVYLELREIGQALEDQGRVQVGSGDYAGAALAYLRGLIIH